MIKRADILVSIVCMCMLAVLALILDKHCPPTPLPGVKVEVITTGYCNTQPCTRYKHGLTKSGERAQRGICAADWRVYPRGTLFNIPGYGPCRIEDTGNKVKGRVVDLFFDTAKEANAWGRTTQWVTLIKYGNGGISAVHQ